MRCTTVRYFLCGAILHREITEARLALAVTDWYEGNVGSAKREVDRAARALLEGKLALPRITEGRAGKVGAEVEGEEDGEEDGGVIAGGVPVPLGLCAALAVMHLITSVGDKNFKGRSVCV